MAPRALSVALPAMLLLTLLFLLPTSARAQASPTSAEEANAAWYAQYDQGVRALEAGRYDEAELWLRTAVRMAGELGDRDIRLGESLSALAQSYGLRGDYSEATRFFRESLDILESRLGDEAPDVALLRSNLAETYRLGGDPDAAEPFYRRSVSVLEDLPGLPQPALLRSLSGLAELTFDRGAYQKSAAYYRRLVALRWTGPGADSGQRREAEERVSTLLEDLASFLSLAYFRDDQFREARETLDRDLDAGTFSESLYGVMTDALLDFRLPSEAERMMSRAIGLFPDSRDLRVRAAELYAKVHKPRHALAAFREASRLESPGSEPGEDVAFRSHIQMRIGELDIGLGRFDDALAAFLRAETLVPGAPEPRLALAGLHLRRDESEEALASYSQLVVENPDLVDGYYGLAEAYRQLGRLSEAVDAATEALARDRTHQRARYTRARALLRSGRTEEGKRELALYRERRLALQSQTDGEATVAAVNRGAAAALAGPHPEEAAQLLLQGLRAQPGAAVLYFNLGVVQRKLGDTEGAMTTWQRMLDLGCCQSGDSFLVHRSLWLENARLGNDVPASEHEALYFREYGVALGAAFGQ